MLFLAAGSIKYDSYKRLSKLVYMFRLINNVCLVSVTVYFVE